MTLKMLNTNYPQCMVFPNNKLYRGNDVYNATTLERLQDEEPLTTVEGYPQSYTTMVSTGMNAGQNSKCVLYNGVFQSKYDPSLVCVLNNGPNRNWGYCGKDTDGSSTASLMIFKNNKLVFKSTWDIFIPIHEDEDYFYFLSKSNRNLARYDNTTLTIYKISKKDFNYSSTNIRGSVSSNTTIDGFFDTCFRFLGVENGILKVLYPKPEGSGASNYYTYDYYFRLLEVNLSTGIIIKDTLASNTYSINNYMNFNTNILPSKIYEPIDEYDVDHFFVASSYGVHNDSTLDKATYNNDNWYIKRFKINPTTYTQIYYIKMNRHPTDTLNVYRSPSSSNSSLYNKWNGKIFEKKDNNGNVYLVTLNRSMDSINYGYLTVDDITLITGKTGGSTSQTNLPLKQEFSNVTDFIECDDTEDTFLIGDGINIRKIQWNMATGMFDELSCFTVGSTYRCFELTDTGVIYVRLDTDTQNAEIITRILPSQGVTLTATFEKDTYRYEGADIYTNVSLLLKNQDGITTSTEQTVALEGNCCFTDTKAKSRKVTFTGSQAITLPVTITGAGAIDCLLTYV